MGSRHLVALAAVCSMVLSGSANAWASAACPTDLVVPGEEQSVEAVVGVVCDINAIRTQNGLRPLRWDWRLWAGAQRMAVDVNRRHFFSHVAPDGRNLVDRLDATGYVPVGGDSWMLGENLGWGRAMLSTPLSIVLGWMNSPAHRQVMLDPAFVDIGVGVAAGSPDPRLARGMTYVANFGTRGNAASVAVTKRPVKHRRRGVKRSVGSGRVRAPAP